MCVRGIDFTSGFYDYLVEFWILIVSVWISVHINF
jgi:hypothetical protein